MLNLFCGFRLSYERTKFVTKGSINFNFNVEGMVEFHRVKNAPRSSSIIYSNSHYDALCMVQVRANQQRWWPSGVVSYLPPPLTHTKHCFWGRIIRSRSNDLCTQLLGYSGTLFCAIRSDISFETMKVI